MVRAKHRLCAGLRDDVFKAGRASGLRLLLLAGTVAPLTRRRLSVLRTRPSTSNAADRFSTWFTQRPPRFPLEVL